MTIQEAKKRLQEIKDVAGDDEVAHSKRDKFWEKVLIEVSHRHRDSALLASIALETEKIEFERWCA